MSADYDITKNIDLFLCTTICATFMGILLWH